MNVGQTPSSAADGLVGLTGIPEEPDEGVRRRPGGLPHTRFSRLWAPLLAFAISAPLAAQSPPASPTAPGAHPTQNASVPFSARPLSKNGTWDIGVWIGEAIGREGGSSFAEAQVSMAAFQLGRVIAGPSGHGWIRGTLTYAFDLIPVFVTTGTQTVYGGGFDPIVLRWVMTGTGRFQPYFEAAGGGVFTTSNVPPGDTSTFNFVPKIGGGVYVYTADRRALAFGLRYWHLSNANLGNQNPAFNGIQLTLGYHWFK